MMNGELEINLGKFSNRGETSAIAEQIDTVTRIINPILLLVEEWL